MQVFGCLHDEAIHARQQQSSENLHKTGHRHDFGRMAAKLPTPEHWRAKATLPHLCWLRTGPTCLYGFGNLVNEKPRLSVAVRFVDECVTRVKVSDSTFADAKEIFSPGEIVEMTLLTGFYMMIARFLATLAVDLDTAWL